MNELENTLVRSEFEQPGDALPLKSAQIIETASAMESGVVDAGQYGTAYLNLLTDDGARLDIVLLGGTQINNTGNRFELFAISDSQTASQCSQFEDMVFVDTFDD